MSRKCIITGKVPQSGNLVSHSKRRTKRKFRPNIQNVRLYSDVLKRSVKIKTTPHGMRIVDAKGGIDKYILSLKPRKICPFIRKLKKEILYNMLYKNTTSNASIN
ncbi:50S ribosomal protein L28 [Lyticum sinuosum]|uniref:Large ribosomal subunit protein bL28 n=1 Tax=Lyticum sinuosum TaxID=1332059 RepID=A0AAE4VKP2_9RICK|nr:50S ribosomal protein L28 [Lyticum sinuosum]MDZ5761024.1 50S ribosomal protein L28 [Lyticum sinuosum]